MFSGLAIKVSQDLQASTTPHYSPALSLPVVKCCIISSGAQTPGTLDDLGIMPLALLASL